MALSLLPGQVFSTHYKPYGICTVSSRGHRVFIHIPQWSMEYSGLTAPPQNTMFWPASPGGSRHPDGSHPYRWTLGTDQHFLGRALTLVYFTYHIANIQGHFEIFVHPMILQGQKHCVYKNTKRDEHVKQRIHRQFRNAFPNIFPS